MWRSPARLVAAASLFCGLLFVSGPLQPLRAETLLSDGREWTVAPGFHGKKKLRKSISGAACAPVSPPVCVVALDEKRHTQFFTIEDETLVPGDILQLLPKTLDGQKAGEIDAEGAAYGDGYFYITGSHGLSRKKAAFSPATFLLFRFPVNSRTGLPVFALSGNTVPQEIERTDALRAILKTADGPIGVYAEKPLAEGEGGVNIEGLAYRDGRIFVGLRGPSVERQAFIVSAGAEALFSGEDPGAEVLQVGLGAGTGIRDLAAVSDGLIVLAGPVQAKGRYALHHLRLSDGALTKIADLGMPEKDLKAETVLVLDESAGLFDLLIMYDGAVDGGPRRMRLVR